MIRFALDLEMEQPCGTIIQIGAVKFDDLTGEILDRFNEYIKLDHSLSSYITSLTGIKNEDIVYGKTLREAFTNLNKFTEECHSLRAVVWGSNDMLTLKTQLPPITWKYGRRVMDVKTLHQFIGPMLGLNDTGGLSKIMSKYGLHFEGKKHNALFDAENTAKLYMELKQYIRV